VAPSARVSTVSTAVLHTERFSMTAL
jgi:hypothetical protein